MTMTEKLDNDLFRVTLSTEAKQRESEASLIRLSMESSIVIAEVQAAYLEKVEQQLEVVQEKGNISDEEYNMISTSLNKFKKEKEKLINSSKKVLSIPAETFDGYEKKTLAVSMLLNKQEQAISKTDMKYDEVKENLEKINSPDFINLVDTTKIEKAVQEAMTLPPKGRNLSKEVPVEEVVDSVMQKPAAEEKTEENQKLPTADFMNLFDSLKKESIKEKEEPAEEVPSEKDIASEDDTIVPAEEDISDKDQTGDLTPIFRASNEEIPFVDMSYEADVVDDTVDVNFTVEDAEEDKVEAKKSTLVNVEEEENDDVKFNTASNYFHTDYASSETSNGSTLEFDSIDMESLKSLKEESEDELRDVTAIVEEKKNTLESKTALLNEKEKESKELDELVKQAKEALTVLAEIEENKQKAQEQQSLLNSFDTEIKTTDTKIAEKDRRIESQKRELEESKEMLTRLQKTGLLSPVKEAKSAPIRRR